MPRRIHAINLIPGLRCCVGPEVLNRKILFVAAVLRPLNVPSTSWKYGKVLSHSACLCQTKREFVLIQYMNASLVYLDLVGSINPNLKEKTFTFKGFHFHFMTHFQQPKKIITIKEYAMKMFDFMKDHSYNVFTHNCHHARYLIMNYYGMESENPYTIKKNVLFQGVADYFHVYKDSDSINSDSETDFLYMHRQRSHLHIHKNHHETSHHGHRDHYRPPTWYNPRNNFKQPKDYQPSGVKRTLRKSMTSDNEHVHHPEQNNKRYSDGEIHSLKYHPPLTESDDDSHSNHDDSESQHHNQRNSTTTYSNSDIDSDSEPIKHKHHHNKHSDLDNIKHKNENHQHSNHNKSDDNNNHHNQKTQNRNTKNVKPSNSNNHEQKNAENHHSIGHHNKSGEEHKHNSDHIITNSDLDNDNLPNSTHQLSNHNNSSHQNENHSHHHKSTKNVRLHKDQHCPDSDHK